MDWYRTKVSHTLYDGMNDREFAAWHRLMALTAQIEKMPNNKQISSICSKKCYESLSKRFQNDGKSVEKVLEKVLEDAREVCSKREYNKIKKRQSREKTHNVNIDSQNSNLTCLELDKIREDKIREDKNNISTSCFKKPTLEEIKSYCFERNNDVNPESFYNHYESTNWFRGKTKIKDWKACIRTWEQNNKKLPARDFETERKLAMIEKFNKEDLLK